MDAPEGKPRTAIGSTADMLLRVRELAEQVSIAVAEREEMLRKLEELRREREALKEQLSVAKATTEMEMHNCAVLRTQLDELRAVAQREVYEERERARREVEAILSKVKSVRDRALEGAKRLEDSIVGAQKLTSALSNELLFLPETPGEAKEETKTGGGTWPATEVVKLATDIPAATTSEDIEGILGLSTDTVVGRKVECAQETRQDPLCVEECSSLPGLSDPLAHPTAGEGASMPTRNGVASSPFSDENLNLAVAMPEIPGPSDAEASGSKGNRVAETTHHRLFISPVRSFRQTEELERCLSELGGVESFGVVSWESLGVIVEIDARMSTYELLDKLNGRFPGLRIAKA